MAAGAPLPLTPLKRRRGRSPRRPPDGNGGEPPRPAPPPPGPSPRPHSAMAATGPASPGGAAPAPASTKCPPPSSPLPPRRGSSVPRGGRGRRSPGWHRDPSGLPGPAPLPPGPAPGARRRPPRSTVGGGPGPGNEAGSRGGGEEGNGASLPAPARWLPLSLAGGRARLPALPGPGLTRRAEAPARLLGPAGLEARRPEAPGAPAQAGRGRARAQPQTRGPGPLRPSPRDYVPQKSQCFTFDDEEREERKKMAQLLITFLERELQPSCQVTCLESIRILSRDKYCLDPFTTKEGLKTLSRHAGIDYSEEIIREVPDLDVILESLKCLCNIVFSSPRAQELSAEARLVVGLAKRIKLYNERSLPHEVKFFDLRLLFLLTALRVDIRQQLAQELRGISLMTDTLELTLGVKWMDPYEVATAEGLLPPLPRQETERAMEILKVLFNITFDSSKREVDEEDAALYRHLGALLRHCLMISADGEDRTEEFHSHTVNLLGNLPLKCLDVLLTPKVRPGSLEYMGVNMDAVSILLDFLERRLDRGHKLKESLTPVLNLLTESARVHRQTRKFLKAKVLPPLRDVRNRPEVGNSLRNKLVRLMTHIDTDVKHCAAEFLFVLCKESVSRFVKYTGYGNAAGLLAARGLMAGGREEGEYSEDEDTDTEEYKEAKPNINPVTGRVEEKLPNPMEGMTEEQKEYEAMKLVNMFDKLSREQVIQPMGITPSGNLAPMENAIRDMADERSSSDSDLGLD
ncbi:chaperone Ric-8A isoform X1 [Mycteria americana]|uniref:chaperone Ric-8A isoform X1 n=1 Tax=Mycteria americana TaxID=33587 RepID=UPI003F58A89A